MQDKIALLMDETGCDRGEAELALEMCGWEVEEAVKTIGRLLKNIVVLKGRFMHPQQNQFGLLLVILNIKSGDLLRSRAVLSYNPAVCSVTLDKGWFEFEKYLYGCRLWEGSLPAESLEIEQALTNHFRSAAGAWADRRPQGSQDAATEDLAAVLKGLLRAKRIDLRLKVDLLDLGQFHSLRAEPEGASRPSGPKSPRAPLKADEQLRLKISLEEDPAGIFATDLRAGDVVAARIVDPRDIAQYLARLFGGYSQSGPVAIAAPVEAIESVPPSGVLTRVRFSVGVCGDALVARESRLKVVRIVVRNQERFSWWRRLFKT